MDKKTILVTGGAGFIGSNFVPYFIKKYPGYDIVNLDKMTYAANLSNLRECDRANNYDFVQGDICNMELLEDIFRHYGITDVIHFAAESHVDKSIEDPLLFVKTNVNGTMALLDVARNAWQSGPHKYKPEFANSRFHHVSTDEVYGALGNTGLFQETTPYSPRSPYSASKASSDHFVRAAHETYGMNVTVSNCSNNYGPKQHIEKFIPKTITNCIKWEPIPVYGRGENVRDWLYVDDHCRAIDLIFHHGQTADTYLIGGKNERRNIDIVNQICAIMDQRLPRKDGRKYSELITFVTDRAGHDLRYGIDPKKITEELKWQPRENFDSGIVKTIDWYIKEYGGMGSK